MEQATKRVWVKTYVILYWSYRVTNIEIMGAHNHTSTEASKLCPIPNQGHQTRHFPEYRFPHHSQDHPVACLDQVHPGDLTEILVWVV